MIQPVKVRPPDLTGDAHAAGAVSVQVQSSNPAFRQVSENAIEIWGRNGPEGLPPYLFGWDDLTLTIQVAGASRVVVIPPKEEDYFAAEIVAQDFEWAIPELDVQVSYPHGPSGAPRFTFAAR
jgi:hypothetical protein